MIPALIGLSRPGGGGHTDWTLPGAPRSSSGSSSGSSQARSDPATITCPPLTTFLASLRLNELAGDAQFKRPYGFFFFPFFFSLFFGLELLPPTAVSVSVGALSDSPAEPIASGLRPRVASGGGRGFQAR